MKHRLLKILTLFCIMICQSLFSSSQVSGQTTTIKNILFPINKNLVSKSFQIPPVVYSMRPGLVITGKYIVMIEPTADNIFTIFELPNCKYIGGFGKLGRGPNEFELPNAFSATRIPGGIRIFDRGEYEVNFSNFPSQKTFSVIQTLKYPPQIQILNSPFRLNDSVIIGIPYPSSDKQDKNFVSGFSKRPYIRYNLNSKKIDFFGEYPKLYPDKYFVNFWLIYFHNTVVSPDNKRFASFGTQVKMFRIYNANSTLEYEEIMKTQNDFFEGQWIRKNAYRFYSSVKATEKYIYAICENEYLNNLLNNKPTLEIWDWNANPIATFQLDRSVAAFDVTNDNRKLYFIDRQTQDKIFMHDLSGLVK